MYRQFLGGLLYLPISRLNIACVVYVVIHLLVLLDSYIMWHSVTFLDTCMVLLLSSSPL